MSAVNFNSEKDAGVGALDRKTAKQRIRQGSKCHKAYPHESRPSCFAHWEGLDEALKGHKHLMANQLGQTAIFWQNRGLGKQQLSKLLFSGTQESNPNGH
jgi:hypothetical protein